MPRPLSSEYSSFFSNYICLTKGNDYNELLANHDKTICDFWTKVPHEKWGFSYSDGKWTVKQLFQHVIDTERILAFRALSIARGEVKSLNNFNENEYAKIGTAINRNPESMILEYNYLRKSSNYLFNSFNNTENKSKGRIGNKTISVNALGFIIIGHCLHHVNICQKLYEIN